DESGSHADDAADVNIHLLHQRGKVHRRGLEILMEHDAGVVHQDVKLRISSFNASCKGCDLRRICNIALDGVELWIFCLQLIERRLPSTGHDDLVSEFEKLEREGKADAGRASSDENGATGEFHKI